jgi:peptidoglycan biosynthesis protein MviN/MurJ (putative lipid II flippase)
MKCLKRFTCTEDERLSAIKNKVFKESLYLVIALCCISIFVKFIILDWKFKTFASEIIIVIASGLHTTIRMVQLGIYSEEAELYDKKHKTPMSTLNIVIGIILGIVMSVLFAVRNTILYGKQHPIYCFVIVFVTCIMIYGGFFAALLAGSHSLADSISRKQSEKHQHDD